MQNGILHQRLKQQGRHGRLQKAGREIENCTKASFKAPLLDADISLEQFAFLSQRNFLPVVVAQIST